MRIECSQEKLKEVVSVLERVAGKHMTLPVLSCFLIEAKKDNTVVFKATNLDLGTEVSFSAKVSTPGETAVPGQVLSSFVNSLHGEDKNVVLEVVDGNLKIKTPHTKVIIKTQLHDDFPSIPRVSSSPAFHINGQDFVVGLKAVWYGASLSSVKPELSSIFIHQEEEFIVFVATDAFRLAEKRVKIKNRTKSEFGQILLPRKNVPEIIHILENVNDDVEVELDKNQISFSHKNTFLISRVVDGTFPDYKQIIPKNISTEITILKQDLLNTLKLSNVFSDKFNQINIKIDPKTKVCEIKTKNNDIGENTTLIDATIEGDPIEINFNYKYIFDSLQSIESDSLTLGFSGLNKPMIIKPISDISFRYLVMPNR